MEKNKKLNKYLHQTAISISLIISHIIILTFFFSVTSSPVFKDGTQ